MSNNSSNSEKIEEQTKLASHHSDEEVIKQRKEKIFRFLKKRYDWIVYILLAVVVFIAVKIRTLNLPGLRDVTTGDWTLGPDLDPWLFWRWGKYIVEHGSLMAVDTMRYVPLGFETRGELIFHPYLIAWFHKFAVYFGSDSFTHSAILYPVFMFALTVVAFFFFVRQLFVKKFGNKNAGIIALISSLFLSVMPALLPRTIAGIPEKESVAFMFMFLAFYLFILALETKSKIRKYLFGGLAGVSTAIMGLCWGGVIYVFLTIALTYFIAFLFGRTNWENLKIYWLWIFVSCLILNIYSERYTFGIISSSTTTLIPFGVGFFALVHLLIYSTNLKKYFSSEKLKKIPEQWISLFVSVLIILIFGLIFLGPDFIADKVQDIARPLITPIQDRLGVTVAENRQPFFAEWASSFGPNLGSLPTTFWLFVIGSVLLVTYGINEFEKKDKKLITICFSYFLIAAIFSRFSPNSIFNGTNLTSIIFYASGFVILLYSFGKVYLKYRKSNSLEKFEGIEFGFILLFSLYFFSLVSARASVRTIMVLVPAASIMISFFIFSITRKAIEKRNDDKFYLKILAGIIIILSIFSAYQLYRVSEATAQAYVPSTYNQQWQKSMAWVRENVSEDAVFSHWWDYGYWIQSIGERATVLDGGNSIPYWNHLMGRHVLTGTDENSALEFLYTHDTTHLLIDPTDIGKYGAFSSIGSDENHDRTSFIPTLLRDPNQVQERKNSTALIYSGGFALDTDITYNQNGTEIFLPAGQAGFAGFIVEVDKNNEIVTNPIAVISYAGKQYEIPLKYVFEKELREFSSGIEAGVIIVPQLVEDSRGIAIDDKGAMLYLSERTVHSHLAKFYLYGEENQNFKLAHSEDDLLVAQIKQQNPAFTNDFIYYQGFRGPIKIWEINYPADIEENEEYLRTDFPNQNLRSTI